MRRTSTTQRVIFQLPPPNAVTFTFVARDAMEIFIPADSKWHVPDHWHYTQQDARSIQVIHGNLVVAFGFSGTMSGGSQHMTENSGPHEFALDEAIEWRSRYDYDKQDKPIPQALMVRLIANENLHRNICSMVLDYHLFPELSSTPFWLKLLFRLLASVPSTREALLRRMLNIQVVLTLHAHDYHERYGYIPFSQMGLWIYPPSWTGRLEWRSMEWISCIVGVACYWIGTFAFGMSAVYPEYTPVVDGEIGKESLTSTK